jgi:EmrB/QacA subfamily drug resistance transporter
MRGSILQPGKEPTPLAAQAASKGWLGLDRKWWVLISIGAGTFMSALDISVVNTVLPVVNQTMHSDIATVQWVVIVYLLLVSGLLPGFGRLGDIRGHKPVYISGFVLFILSSLLCALARSVYMLILFRGLQSLGAAMLSANSPAILTKSFPAQQRGQALGMQATMTYLGLTVGPSLGGWLTQNYGWPSVFYINLPVGFLALFLSYRSIQADGGRKTMERFDWPGAALFMAGFIALLLGLNQGHNWGWTSPAILALLGGAVVILGIFIWVENHVRSPMLDLSLFRIRLFSLSVASAVINYMCVNSITFLLPFYLLQGRQWNPAEAGLILTAQPIIMAIVAPISGTLSDRIGARLPVALGMGIIVAGLAMMSRLTATSPIIYIVSALMVTGLGIGIFISPNNSALMGSAPSNRQGIAAGLLATSRNVGMVLGIGLAGAVFTTALSNSTAVAGAGLFSAVQASFSVMIAVALVGFIVSALRGA